MYEIQANDRIIYTVLQRSVQNVMQEGGYVFNLVRAQCSPRFFANFHILNKTGSII